MYKRFFQSINLVNILFIMRASAAVIEAAFWSMMHLTVFTSSHYANSLSLVIQSILVCRSPFCCYHPFMHSQNDTINAVDSLPSHVRRCPSFAWLHYVVPINRSSYWFVVRYQVCHLNIAAVGLSSVDKATLLIYTIPSGLNAFT